MKLTSNWTKGKVYWRRFNQDDTVYLTGNEEGFISNGQSAEINDPRGFFQLEIKRGDIFGSFLIRAGKILNNDDELVLTDKGELVSLADLADVQIDPNFKLEFLASSASQFFSLLNSSINSEYEITTSFSQELSTGFSKNSKITNSVTDTKGAKIGPDLTVNGGNKNGTSASLKINGELSKSIADKIENVIENNFSFKSTSDSTYSEKHKAIGTAKKITVYTYSWQRKYITGKVILGQNITTFEATLGYITSEERSEFNSAAELPADLRVQYDASFSSNQNNSIPDSKKQFDGKAKNKIIGLGRKCIDVAGAGSTNGTSIVLWQENGGENQIWQFDGEFIVTVMDANKCLDVQGGVANNGTPIILWERNGGLNQKWIYNAAEGSFSSMLDPSKCIDVRGNENKNGAVIQLWEKNGGDNQKWYLG